MTGLLSTEGIRNGKFHINLNHPGKIMCAAHCGQHLRSAHVHIAELAPNGNIRLKS
jgi:hypothetical protein